jgi:uncharacterized membrane protein YhaH (DUF805 family)
MLKSLSQVDRRSFWMWTVPIAAVHCLLSIAMANAMELRPLGPMDTLLILLLAVVLVGRFRDIGWPTWIGASFLIATMLVVPFVVLFYAIASGDKALDLPRLMMLMSGFNVPANFLLLVVAGCVPGRSAAIIPHSDRATK